MQSLKEGTLIADGSEQTLLEYMGLGKVSGYIYLDEMGAGDTIHVREYMLEGASYLKHADEIYKDVQDNPALHVPMKETDMGIKITLQQMGGILRSFRYDFLLG